MSNDIDINDFHERLHQFSIKHEKPWWLKDSECNDFEWFVESVALNNKLEISIIIGLLFLSAIAGTIVYLVIRILWRLAFPWYAENVGGKKNISSTSQIQNKESKPTFAITVEH